NPAAVTNAFLIMIDPPTRWVTKWNCLRGIPQRRRRCSKWVFAAPWGSLERRQRFFRPGPVSPFARLAHGPNRRLLPAVCPMGYIENARQFDLLCVPLHPPE